MIMELKTTQNFRHNTPLTKNMNCAPYQHFSTILFFFIWGNVQPFSCPLLFRKNDKKYLRVIWPTHNIAAPYLLSPKSTSKWFCIKPQLILMVFLISQGVWQRIWICPTSLYVRQGSVSRACRVPWIFNSFRPEAFPGLHLKLDGGAGISLSLPQCDRKRKNKVPC